jgi:hypothetical protein
VVTAAVVASGAGTAYASSGALPGDPLYPVKRGLESAELRVVAYGDKARGQHLIERADTRLGEVERLVADTGSTPVVAAALDDFAEASVEGARLVFAAYEDKPDTALLVELDGQLVTQERRLLAMLPGLPGESFVEGDRTLARLVATGGQVARLLSGCAACPTVLSAGAVVGPMLDSLPLTAAAVRDVKTGGGEPDREADGHPLADAVFRTGRLTAANAVAVHWAVALAVGRAVTDTGAHPGAHDVRAAVAVARSEREPVTERRAVPVGLRVPGAVRQQ